MEKDNEMFKLLNEESKKAVLEAIEQKVNEARKTIREEVETEVRQEFARRYDHDRNQLVEAMDRMLTEAIKEELSEFQIDRKALLAEKDKLTKAVTEARTHYKTKQNNNISTLNDFVLKQLKEEMAEFTNDRQSLSKQRVKLSKQIVENKKNSQKKIAENVDLLKNFVLKQLTEEMHELAQDRRLLQEQRIKMAKQIKESRTGYEKQLKDRVKTLESFVLKQLTNEMKEFNDDKKALVESRVKLVSEGKKKLNETKAAFIKRAAAIVEQTIETTLKTEMTQFKNDLKNARENNFGRRIFEAFAAEYMSSYLAEGTEIKKLQKEIDVRDQKLVEAVSQLKKHQSVLSEAKGRIVQAEDAALRTKILNECLKNLARDKRVVMEELLETVKTANLKEAFAKYLPSVLGEADTRLQKDGRKKLTETNVPTSKPVVVTGNRNNRLSETVNAEKNDVDAINAEIIQIKKMAGI